MKDKPKPIDVFNKLFKIALSLADRFSYRRKAEGPRGIPGELLNRLSVEEREIISGLSSNDIADEDKIERGMIEMSAYPDSFSWQEKEAKENLSKDKMEFDKKLHK